MGEFLELLTWSERYVTPSHFRTREQDEVELVLEDRRGRIVGIEVKSAATLRSNDSSGLKKLQEAAGANMFEKPVTILLGLGIPTEVKSVMRAYQILMDWRKAADHSGELALKGARPRSTVKSRCRRPGPFLSRSLSGTICSRRELTVWAPKAASATATRMFDELCSFMRQVKSCRIGSHLFNALELEEIDAVVAIDHHSSHDAIIIDLTEMVNDGLGVICHRSTCHPLERHGLQ